MIDFTVDLKIKAFLKVCFTIFFFFRQFIEFWTFDENKRITISRIFFQA